LDLLGIVPDLKIQKDWKARLAQAGRRLEVSRKSIGRV
jgi:hypothetical protein